MKLMTAEEARQLTIEEGGNRHSFLSGKLIHTNAEKLQRLVYSEIQKQAIRFNNLCYVVVSNRTTDEQALAYVLNELENKGYKVEVQDSIFEHTLFITW